ncbi:MAG: hypothetical protein AB7P03_10565 [Kofleriaceae bacterium]
MGTRAHSAYLAVIGLAACGGSEGRSVGITVDVTAPVARVDERFVGIAVDTAQVVGGEFWDPFNTDPAMPNVPVPPYDFSRPRLRELARALAPAMLRIGGTDADLTYYDLSDTPIETPVAPDRWVLTRAKWDGVLTFAELIQAPILFTLNAGAAHRNEAGQWIPDNARTLIDYSVANGDRVAVWELGNEVNLYPAIHRLSLDPVDYAADTSTAKALLDERAPGALLAAPSSAYWPVSGEIRPFYPAFMNAGSATIDLVTWHYYPQQSGRCPFASRAAEPGLLLDPANLDEIHTWAAEVEAARDQRSPQMPVWLGETGHAQCGGEPGLSDAFEASLWWVDELGLIARRGQPMVIRQTLSGGSYGLIDEASLEPNPDYWATLLWRRVMGPHVLAATTSDPTVRAYAHCTPGMSGAVTVVAINLDATQPAQISLNAGASSAAEVYVVSAPSRDARIVTINGEQAVVGVDNVPVIPAATSGSAGSISVPPASFAFAVMTGAAAAACSP